MMLALIVISVALAIGLLSFIIVPLISEITRKWVAKKEEKVAKELDKLFYDKSPREIVRLYFILVPVLAIAGYVISQSVAFMVVGAVAGLFIPNMMMRLRNANRMAKFNKQILDAIMVLSSSLKGGLSLLQALEVLTEELPPPMSQEIGLVIRENKMGIALEDSLRELNKRMKSSDLELVVNSLLVARETGGDLTKVLSRLSVTIRDNRKLQDSIRTLTLQGRMQAVIMSILPFGFAFFVYTTDKHHFDIMLQSETGRGLLFAAVFLQIIGMFLIKKFSTIKV